jgi:pimeloyl-ACP methyl ester carboxylesterase
VDAAGHWVREERRHQHRLPSSRRSFHRPRFVPGWVSHVEYAWEVPSFAAFLQRLASFARLIFIDRRGTGLSDRAVGLPTLEQRMDDVRAVLDGAGSERAALFGIFEGGPMCTLFAATHPERTSALVLYGTIAAGRRDENYPWAARQEVLDRFLATIQDGWGKGVTPRLFAPTIAGDPQQVQLWAAGSRPTLRRRGCSRTRPAAPPRSRLRAWPRSS